MHRFASGFHRNYYGKAAVTVYRVNRESGSLLGADVTMLLYGDVFWATYTTGDNTGLIATDSMKNFIQLETLNYKGPDLESYCRFLAEKFLETYPQSEGIQVSATEIPWSRFEEGGPALAPSGPERATARIEVNRTGVVEIASGLCGFKLLRTEGSSFTGFVRDRYTTLPEITNRPLQMWLDLEWTCPRPVTDRIREIVRHEFSAFESGSIQQVIYQIGTRILEELPAVSEVNLEANNRTWDTVAEQGEQLGVLTEARPPYGVLGLSLKR
jgi:urate oxidase